MLRGLGGGPFLFGEARAYGVLLRVVIQRVSSDCRVYRLLPRPGVSGAIGAGLPGPGCAVMHWMCFAGNGLQRGRGF